MGKYVPRIATGYHFPDGATRPPTPCPIQGHDQAHTGTIACCFDLWGVECWSAGSIRSHPSLIEPPAFGMEPRVGLGPLMGLCDLSHPTTKTAGLMGEPSQPRPGPLVPWHPGRSADVFSSVRLLVLLYLLCWRWGPLGQLVSFSNAHLACGPPGYMSVTVTFQRLHSISLPRASLPSLQQRWMPSLEGVGGGTTCQPACQILSRLDPDATSF